MRKFFVLLPALLLAAVSCSVFKGNSIQVSDTNFDEQVEIVQNLVFTFNRSIVSPNKAGLWDTTPYVKFTPAIPGSFKWTSESELVFSPAVGLKPSTEYKAELNEVLGQTPEKKYSVDAEPLVFHTPYLGLNSAEAFWAKNERGVIEARARLKFNFTVDPNAVAKLLQATSYEQKTKFQILTTQPATELVVALPAVSSKTDESTELAFTIAPGLRCVNGEKPTAEPLQAAAYLDGVGSMKVQAVTTDHVGGEGVINVFFSQEPDADQIQSYFKIKDWSYWRENEYSGFKTNIQHNRLEIRGLLAVNESYKLILNEGLRGVAGGKLEKEYTHRIEFLQEAQTIAFSSARGVYLSEKGERLVEIDVSGVPEVTVKVAKIYENNLIHFFRNGASYGYEYNEDWGGNEYTYYNIEGFGDTLFTQTIQTANLRRNNGKHLLKLDFADKRESIEGVYVVEVASKDNLWIRANKVIAITDIGLMAKEGASSMTIIAHSISKAEPLKGVKINLISSNNQQILATETDGDGVAVINDLKTGLNGFNLSMLTAKHEKDFNYLLLDQTRVETSRFDVGGKATQNLDYDAFIYGDRDVYRPGETVNFNTLIRTFSWEPVPDMPVFAKILYPNGREFKTINGSLNAQGALASSFSVPPAAPTGQYVIEIYTASKKFLKSRTVYIEEFMPDRIKVDIALDKTQYKPGDAINANVTARNYFGPPAANRKYEVELNFRKESFRPKGFDDYVFDIIDETNLASQLRNGMTNNEGKSQEMFTIPPHYANMGLLKGVAFTTVFDENGRPVSRAKGFDIFTQNSFAGIGSFESYVSTNAALKIPLAAVSPEGKAQNGVKVNVKLIRNLWETVIERNDGRYNYTSRKSEQLMLNKLLTLNGENTTLDFTPGMSGEYEIRVSLPGTDKYVRRTFYAFGWGTTTANAFKVKTDGEIDITPDKAEYETGDKAKILFKTPFDGRLIVTLERDKVYKQISIETENRAASASFSLDDEHQPNVFVNATLIRKMDGQPIPFTVAHGFKNLKVRNKEYKIDVQIAAAKTSRSRRQQTVSIKTRPNAQITVAVVDQGILALRNTPTPDPYEYYYAPRALEVQNYDLYALLLPEIGRKNQKLGGMSSGGDGFAYLAKANNPISNKRVKPMSKWSGILKADGSGNVKYTFDVPQFSGELRLMAVAYDGKSFGSGEQTMTIADPIVLSAAVPRFLSPGDTALVPVTLSNTTAQAATAAASVKVTGPLHIASVAQQNVTVPPNGEAVALFKIAGKKAVGEASIDVVVNALGESFHELTELPVRPASPLQQKTGSGVINGGAAQTVSLAAPDFMPQSLQSKLVISRSPMVEFAKDLSYLIEYPHGCIEQTVSTAFPQIYFSDLTRSLQSKKGKQAGNPAANVQAAINKIESMQTYSGAFTYWPGDDRQESWWGTAYGLHFLIEAKSAGFDVSDKTIREAKRYLQNQINYPTTVNYYLADGTYMKAAPREAAYSVFVLTLAGQKPVSTLNYYKTNAEVLTPDSRYLLAAAHALLGDQDGFRFLLPGEFSSQTKRETGGSFSSPLRDKALALYALLQANPKHPQVPVMAKQVSESLKAANAWGYSTQERIFAFLALGKMAKANANATVTAEVLVDGKIVGKFDGKDLTIDKDIAGKQVQIKTTGSGSLYYFWNTSGLDEDGAFATEQNYLSLKRTFLDRNGRTVTGGTFKQSDLIVVKLSVSATFNENIENVAISDLLPAGFEIENPRIKETPELAWIKDAAEPDYLDIRDDRIHLFATVSGTVRNYYYVVRAVSPGQYKMGAAAAEAMYAPEYHAYTESQTIRVAPFAGGEAVN